MRAGATLSALLLSFARYGFLDLPGFFILCSRLFDNKATLALLNECARNLYASLKRGLNL